MNVLDVIGSILIHNMEQEQNSNEESSSSENCIDDITNLFIKFCHSPLTGLPSEIIVHVFSFLDQKSLISAGVACKILFGLSLDSSLWKEFSQTTRKRYETIFNEQISCAIKRGKMGSIDTITDLIREIKLQGPEIQNSTLESLQHFRGLQSLVLKKCENLKYLGLHVNKVASLTSFKWESSHQLMDCHLKDLVFLTHLVSLRLKVYASETGRVETLEGLTNLTFLNLKHSQLKNYNLRGLSNLLRLQKLDLRDCHLEGKGLKHLTKLSALKSLKVGYGKFRSNYVRSLGSLSQLTSLQLYRRDELQNDDFYNLSSLPNLTDLRIRYCQVLTGGVLRRLYKLTNLTCLDLSGCHIEDRHLCSLQIFSNLTSLSLTGCHALTANCDEDIAKLTRLTFLSMAPEVLFTGFKPFKILPQLKHFTTNANAKLWKQHKSYQCSPK